MPDCPGAAVLEDRLAEVLANHPAAEVDRQVIATQEEAERAGMTGSPTLLLDGRDPFARAGQQPASRAVCTVMRTAGLGRPVGRPVARRAGRACWGCLTPGIDLDAWAGLLVKLPLFRLS